MRVFFNLYGTIDTNSNFDCIIKKGPLKTLNSNLKKFQNIFIEIQKMTDILPKF